MKVLVTGSSGFIGKNLIPLLDKKGYQIIRFDKQEGKDVLSWKDFESLPKADIVVHLAGLTFVPFSFENPMVTYDVNVRGTLHALEYCRKNGAGMIFPSTYVYGHPQSLPVDEKHPVVPSTPYSRSKVIAEQLISAYHLDFKTSSLIFRLFNLYGKGQDERFLIPTILKQVDEDGEQIVLDDLSPKRDYIHISDVVDALALGVDFLASKKEPCHEVFNIGSGESMSVKEIAEAVLRVCKKERGITSRNKIRKAEIMDVVADVKKAKRLLGWTPKMSFEDGICHLVTGK